MIDHDLLEWHDRLANKYTGNPIKYIGDCMWQGSLIKLKPTQKRMIDFEYKFKETIVLCPRDQGKTFKNATEASFYYNVLNKNVSVLSLSHARSKDIKRIASTIQEQTDMLSYALPYFSTDNVDHLNSPLGGSITAVPFSTGGIMGGHPDIYLIDEASQFYDNAPGIETELFTTYIIPSQIGLTRTTKKDLPELHITTVGGNELSFMARFLNSSLAENITNIKYSFGDFDQYNTQSEKYKYLFDIISDDYIKKTYTEISGLNNPTIYHAGGNTYKIEDDSLFLRVELFKNKIKIVDKENAFEVLHIQPEECGYTNLLLERLRKQGLSQYSLDTQFYCKFVPRGTEKLSTPEIIKSLLTNSERQEFDPVHPTIGAIDKGVTTANTVLVIVQTTPNKQINYITSYTDDGKNPSIFLEKIETEIQPTYKMFPILVDTTSDDTFASCGARYSALPMVGFKFDQRTRSAAMTNMKVILESVVKTPDGLNPRLRIPANDEGRRLVTALIDTQFSSKHHLDDRVAALLMALWQARSIIYEEPEETNTCLMCGNVQKGGERCIKCNHKFTTEFMPIQSNEGWGSFSVNNFSSASDWDFGY